MKFTKRTILSLIWLLLAMAVKGQDNIQVMLGPDEIGENQAWTITVTVNNERLKSYENFPDLEGFRKRGTSTQSQTSIVNGQVSSSQSIVMTYLPTKQGTFTIPSFKMKVNEQIISVTGKRVKVGPAVQTQQRDPFRSFFDRDPTDDFFGRGETEFVDIKEDALLAFTTNKDEVYVGEGFTATLSFLVADNNRAPMQFHELGKQLADILKKLRPADCWEENFNIENIEGEHVEIQGKGFTQYKIFQASFYPLNTKPVEFPSVGLEMIKFKVAKNPSFFGQNRQEDFKKFYSKAKTIKVKELPPHPLRDAVAVGDYRLDEKIGATELETGQSVSYEFRVLGEGNISSVEKPTLPKDNVFDFYEPNIKQSVNRESNRVAGTKSFNYFMIPKEPGTFNLGDYFQWVFFNPTKEKYDTLRSKYTLQVKGESQKNQFIESTDLGSFYDRMDGTDNRLQTSTSDKWIKIVANLFIMVTLGLTIYLTYSRRTIKEESSSVNYNFKTSTKMEKKDTQKVNIKTIVGIVVGVGIFILVQQVLFKTPSFDKVMMSAANELNKSCPLMVDQDTRLDNAIALPDNKFQYNYTLVNFEKESLNVDELKGNLVPSIVNNVKTNPGMKIFRDNNATIVYSYKDKKSIFLFEIIITPDQYNSN